VLRGVLTLDILIKCPAGLAQPGLAGLKRDFESPSVLASSSASRGFKSRACNHLPANRLLEFRFEIVI